MKKWDEMKNKLVGLKTKRGALEFERLTLECAKEELIKNVMLFNEANRKFHHVDYREVKKKYLEIKQHFEKEKIPNVFHEGNDFSIKENIENYLKLSKLLDEWGNEKNLSDEETKQFYDKNRHLFDWEDFYLFEHVSCDMGNRLAMEEVFFSLESNKKERAMSVIKSTQGFRLVENNLIQKGALQGEVEAIIFRLKEGENSKIISAHNELHIFTKKSDLNEPDFQLIKQVVRPVCSEHKRQAIIKEKLSEFKTKVEIVFQS